MTEDAIMIDALLRMLDEWDNILPQKYIDRVRDLIWKYEQKLEGENKML